MNEKLQPFFDQVFTSGRTKLTPDQVFLRLQWLHESRHQISDLAQMDNVAQYYDLNELNPFDCDLEERNAITRIGKNWPALKAYVDDRNELQYYSCFKELKQKLDREMNKLHEDVSSLMKLRFEKLKKALVLDSRNSLQVNELLIRPDHLKEPLLEGLVRYICLMGGCLTNLKSFKKFGPEIGPQEPDSAGSSIRDQIEWHFRDQVNHILMKPCQMALKIVGPAKRYFDILKEQNAELIISWLDPFTLNSMLGAQICELILDQSGPITRKNLWSVRSGMIQDEITEEKREKERKRKVERKKDSRKPFH